MKKTVSTKDTILIVLLLIIVIGVVYYLAFLKPLQAEINSVQLQSQELDSEIALASARVGALQEKKAEVEEILAQPASKITEIAPYDNSAEVLDRLNSVLKRSDTYNLSFADPNTDDNGIVRRVVNLSFTAKSYSQAKSILSNLSGWNYRSQMGNLNVSAKEDSIKEGSVSVTAAITFFESVNLEK